MPRVVRSNSRCPSSRSSWAICLLSAGWEMRSRRAARFTEPSSATATKYRR